MFRFYCVLTFCLFSLASLFAQEQAVCGFTDQEAFLHREKMFQNRERYSLERIQALQKQQTTLYIPVVIHLVGSSNGTGFASPANALTMICRLNSDFANQNIQFFLKDSIHFVRNDIIYANAYEEDAIDEMILLKDNMAANIFVNTAAGGGIAGYYSRRGDFVFMLNAYAHGGSTTITHEFGHFFTLMHTFYGWEGTNARALYNSTPAPDSLDAGHAPDVVMIAVEYVDRSGPLANCYGAADGFCDTKADYISSRAACPMTGTALDPSSVPISPDTRLFMSYFFDSCVDSFSTEQKNAIMADIIDRGWTAFSAPDLSVFHGTAVQALNPTNNQNILLSGNTTRIEWDTTGASLATGWVLQIDRMVFGTVANTIFRGVVNGRNYYDLPNSLLQNNGNYRWQVKPYSNGNSCANPSSFFNFTASNPTGINAPENLFEAANLVILGNPVKQQASIVLNIPFEIEASLSLYSIDGRLISQSPMEQWQAGENYRQIDLSSLSSGNYTLVWKSALGALHARIIKH